MTKSTEPPLPQPVEFEHNGKTYSIPGDCLSGKYIRTLRYLCATRRAENLQDIIEQTASMKDRELAKQILSEARMRAYIPMSDGEVISMLKDPDVMKRFLPEVLDCSKKEADDIVENFPYFLALADMFDMASDWTTYMGNLNTRRAMRNTAAEILLNGSSEASTERKSTAS